MGLLEFEKEGIALLRFWLSVVVGSFLATAGFVAVNFATMPAILLCSSLVFLIVLLGAGVAISWRLHKKIHALKEL